MTDTTASHTAEDAAAIAEAHRLGRHRAERLEACRLCDTAEAADAIRQQAAADHDQPAADDPEWLAKEAEADLSESTLKEDARNAFWQDALTDTGVEQVEILINGPSTPGWHYVDDEDARRDAVAWLLGNISADPALAERIAIAAGLVAP